MPATLTLQHTMEAGDLLIRTNGTTIWVYEKTNDGQRLIGESSTFRRQRSFRCNGSYQEAKDFSVRRVYDKAQTGFLLGCYLPALLGRRVFLERSGGSRDLAGVVTTEKPAPKKREKREPSQAAKAAAEIRVILKDAFPGISFSVRSRYFANGSSIDIGWAFGPPTREVQPLVGQYQDGSFDGMQDLYEYHRDGRPGGAKYVHCQRSYSRPDDEDETAFWEELCRALCDLGHREYKGIHTRWDKHGYDTVRDVAYRVLGQARFGPEGYRGVRRTDCTCGRVEEFYAAY